MLFRDTNGLLIEINKSSFKNDQLYYTKMSEVKGLNATPSLAKAYGVAFISLKRSIGECEDEQMETVDVNRKSLLQNTPENIKIKISTNIGDNISKESNEKYSTQAIEKLLSSF